MSATKQGSAYPIRLPPELRQKLEEEAKANERTLHGQIIHTLRKVLEPKTLAQ